MPDELDFNSAEFLGMSAKDRVRLCRRLAQRAQEIADVSGPKYRENYLEIADEWRMLADEIERAELSPRYENADGGVIAHSGQIAASGTLSRTKGRLTEASDAARRYHNHAEELRTIAAGKTAREIRSQLLRLADGYEHGQPACE